MGIYDLTVTIWPGMPTWPGEEDIRLDPVSRISLGDVANVSRLALGTHTGTHVDAPWHFHDAGPTVDQLPLEVLVGEGYVADMGQATQIGPEELRQAEIPAGVTRLLLKTTNSRYWAHDKGGFQKDFVAVTPEGAQWIVERGIRLIGIDYLSVERFGSLDHAVHRTFATQGVIAIEGLNLGEIPAGWYQILCLPLKIAGADGAPARVIAVGPLNRK